MIEDKVNDVEQRAMIRPFISTEGALSDGPTLIRDYYKLQPLDHYFLEQSAQKQNDSDHVYLPIGGCVHLNRYADSAHRLLDDVVIVPKQEPLPGMSAVMSTCQVPIFIDTKPPMSGDESLEVDAGRFPVLEDLLSSAAGQKKEDEMVLAIPTALWAYEMLTGEDRNPVNMTEHLFDNLTFVRRDWCETDERFVQLLPYFFFWKRVGDETHIFVYQRGKDSGEGRLAMKCSIGVGGHINPVDFFSTQQFAEVSGMHTEVKNHARRGERLLAEGFWAGIVNCVLRESDEEVLITDGEGKQVDLLDIINKDIGDKPNQSINHEQWLQRRTTFFLDLKASAVERVHLGMYIGIELPSDFNVVTREEILHDVGFRSLESLWLDNDEETLPTRLEFWSRSIVDSVYETIQFIRENPTQREFSERFTSEQGMVAHAHAGDPETLAKIPLEDRWKIGTLAGSMSHKYRLYAMNAFIRA